MRKHSAKTKSTQIFLFYVTIWYRGLLKFLITIITKLITTTRAETTLIHSQEMHSLTPLLQLFSPSFRPVSHGARRVELLWSFSPT
jgi:hypothetical protein